MRRSARDIKVGLFTAAAMAVLIVFLAVLGGVKMWSASNVYHIRFEESVAGLDKGSPVRLKGVRVGTVDDLKIPPDDITKVEVTISVDKSTPMKVDTDATIASVGITGLRYIELIPGSVDADDLPSGSSIVGTESFLASISGTAETAVLKGEILIDNLLAITSSENRDLLERFLADLSAVVRNNRGEIAELVKEARAMSVSLTESSDELRTALEENREDLKGAMVALNEVMTSLKPFAQFAGDEETIARLNELIYNGSELALRLNTLVGDNQYSMDQTLIDFRESARNLNDFTRSIRARPSLILRGAAVGPRVVKEE
jgi:phospholipid/cholesterol/gamma-HCH transport system substrate-binding protein